MKKVSIIVPFYNVEEYIERSIKSLVEQSLEDIEIILVNDGSKDNSLNIIEGIRIKDNRFEFDITNSSKYYSCPIEQIDEALNVSDIYVQFQDKILGFETPPVIESGSTLVPMRFLFEQMGADVEWNGETQTATATLDNTAVTFAIDDTNAEVNNTPATMDVPARLINGKTMVPLRFLSEEMGFEVAWDAESRTAIIE